MDVEICINAGPLASIRRDVTAALAGGADRIELCHSMEVGGLSPTPEQIQTARAALGDQWGLMVMVRPRPGDFAYNDAEQAQMAAEIDRAAQSGADGVVLGLVYSGRVDEGRLTPLVERAKERGLSVTFHRAIDATDEPAQAVLRLIPPGVDRVLISGVPWGAVGGVAEGVGTIRHSMLSAGRQLEFVLGGGVTPEGIGPVLRQLPRWPTDISLHAYSSAHRTGRVDAERVASLKQAARAIHNSPE